MKPQPADIHRSAWDFVRVGAADTPQEAETPESDSATNLNANIGDRL
jgi:hypothetical protein